MFLHSIGVVSLLAIALYFYNNNQVIGQELALLGARQANTEAEIFRLTEQLNYIESRAENVTEATDISAGACDTSFATGVYVLRTNTKYGPDTLDGYEIYHASMELSTWSINAGMRLNSYGIPTDFYFDYDGDGRIDTALAARFVREIPVAGNTIADRLLADSRVHQNLYSVFRCEWRNAEFTSSEDMNQKVSGKSAILWDLLKENSASITQWIQSE
jgi:hypothetical protein